MNTARAEGTAVACHGAPRDLGLDQGVALRHAIAAAVETLPWRSRIESALGGGLADPLSARVDRDLRRHFPHMAERLDGLARGAGVRPGELAALLARELCASAAPGPGASPGLLAAFAPEGNRPALVGRTLPARGVVERASAPDHDYPSRESIVPWLVPPLGGANDRGLCVVGAAHPVETVAEAGCAAPALLLVQDCLQRFDATEKAVEWCEGRPAGGHASLLIADADGDVALVEIEGDDRRVRRPGDRRVGGLSGDGLRVDGLRADGLLVDGLLVVARTPAEGDALRKAVLEAAGDPSAALRDALAASGDPVAIFEARPEPPG